MILTLYLTLDCNQRCRYCYAKPHLSMYMTEETARNAIDLAAGETAEQGGVETGVRFFGGEPLLCWRSIPPLVEYARAATASRGLKTSFAISTNGLLLEPEQVAFMRQNSFAVGISIDGPQDVHDRNRVGLDGLGTFAHTLEKARMALEYDLRVELVLVVDPSTVADLGRSVRYLHEETGGSFFTVSFNIHAPWSEEQMNQLERSYRELGDYYVEMFEKGSPVQIDFLNNKMNVLLRGGFIREYLCQIGKTDLAVSPDGRLYPCLRLAAMDPEGTTATGTVAGGLDLAKVAALRELCDGRYTEEGRPERCRSCPDLKNCLNWCAAANLAMTGHPATVGEVMCRHEKVSAAVAAELLGRIDRARYMSLYAEYFSPSVLRTLCASTPHGEASA